MTSVAPQYQAPLLHKARLQRLVLNPAAVDWAEVEEVVRSRLDGLHRAVAKLRGDVRSTAGSNRTQRFPLFAYRTFDTAPGFDPIVVGVTFTRTVRGIRIVGDVCGEETGKVYVEDPCLCAEVPETSQAVLSAAHRVAAELAKCSNELLAGLENPEPSEP